MYRWLVIRCAVGFATIGPLAGIAPAIAQSNPDGRVAVSAVGEVGQRQIRGQGVAGVNPTARIDGRIQSRVQSRIRNRVDRYYDPQANAVSPFVVAGEQVRSAGTPRGR